jgi:hypothetical protein
MLAGLPYRLFAILRLIKKLLPSRQYSVVKCTIHTTEHGSDHRAIETTFDIATPERVVETRLLFKNAPWNDITRIANVLRVAPVGGTVQQQTDQLMTVVLEAVINQSINQNPTP